MTNKRDGKDSLVLFSGGMDSTISLFHRLNVARKEGGRVHTLSFFYGQRHEKETLRARQIVSMIQSDPMYRDIFGQFRTQDVNYPQMPRGSNSLVGALKADIRKYDNVAEAQADGGNDPSFIPYRNMLFMAYAAIHARAVGANIISTGLRGGFPDCTLGFEHTMAHAAIVACPDHVITIDTPTHQSREDCVRYAVTLPGCMEALGMSHTCFEGRRYPCGRCLPCLKRAEGFAAVGIEDPLLRRLNQNRAETLSQD